MKHIPCKEQIVCGPTIKGANLHVCTLDIRDHPEFHYCFKCGFVWKGVENGI